MTFDVIVVGSGPAGANAAAALVERSRRVLMLDVGDVDTQYQELIPARSFREIRESDAAQHRYLLGDDFEGLPPRGVRVGAQLTPPRSYVTGSAPRLVPVTSQTFSVAESLALGGLGAAWGAGVFEFDAQELAQWPIGLADLRPHYDAVSRRIGVSAAADDLARFCALPAGAMPPLDIDSNAERLLSRYLRKRVELNARGFFMGRVGLAVSTRAHHGRGPHEYRDMDFWTDSDRSVYRPRFTIEALRQSPAFTYVNRQLVLRFVETADGVTVTARDVDSGREQDYRARALVLGAGTLGTARIVLRSLQRYDERVPLLSNPYTYVPVLNWSMLGQEARDRRHSLAQLTAIYQPPDRRADGARGSVQVQLYSYRSLLTFRLLNETPLPYREGLRAMQLLLPALGILGINHDDRRSDEKYLQLRHNARNPDGQLDITYALTANEEARIAAGERAVLHCFRRLGAWAIKRVHPGHGSSIHYAGTFPMTPDARGLTSAPDGRLGPTRAVYLVDGSPFPYLPAKGLTFTIMANANRVGTMLADRLI